MALSVPWSKQQILREPRQAMQSEITRVAPQL
jgi:hypothetical protein